MRTEDANRERLVQFLRDEDAQRGAGFCWDYSKVFEPRGCGTFGCAIGAARLLGIARTSDDLLQAIGLPESAKRIFFDYGHYGYPLEVTAAMVADKIEEVAREGYGG